MKQLILFVIGLAISLTGCSSPSPESARWSAEKANAWYAKQPFLVGCNFLPSTAVNQLEMWQADTFDLATIDRELGWAENIGMNTVRVYLHDLAWQADPKGFKKRMDQFLTIAERHHIRPLFVFFDDCWNENPKIGKQPALVPGVHNSGWVKSPGNDIITDPAKWVYLESYVKDILRRFKNDSRILLWDLYNEPGNRNPMDHSLPLLQKTFTWARQIRPSQPLTAGVWNTGEKFNALNDFQLASSDIITFHNYNDADNLQKQIQQLKSLGRPVICTEWLRRPVSTVATHLPIFRSERVGCINWGLVSGKSQTIFPWGSPAGAPEPSPWFHDLLHPDGSPYNPDEIQLFHTLRKSSPADK